MRLLALDFDGVISDSASESFVVALRTYLAFLPGSSLMGDASDLMGTSAPLLERVHGAPAYAPFLQMMPLGNRAEDYAVVLAAIDAGLTIADQPGYDRFRAEQDPAWLSEFHRRFYAERKGLSGADPEGWRRLMAPYAPIVDLLRRRAVDAVLAIATSKDRRSVEALLRLYGIEDLFPADRILDKETGPSKRLHLEVLARRFDVDFPGITFVDDKVNHLDRVAPLGTRCGLAAWGYNGDREIALARKRGYLVCTLAEAERQLFG